MNARLYDLLARVGDRKGFGDLRSRLVSSLEGDVLELGAGTGLMLAHYRRAARVVALEPDAAMVERLRERARAAIVPVEVVEGRAEELPFPAASFEHVVAGLVLCSVDDLERVLAEIRRVLRPGGSLALLEHVRGEGRLARWQDRLTPLQRRIADGCELNRETFAAVADAGFATDGLERLALPAVPPWARPGLYGRATRISS